MNSKLTEIEKAMEAAPTAGHNQLITLAVNHLPSLVRVARAAEKLAKDGAFDGTFWSEAMTALRSALAALEGGEK